VRAYQAYANYLDDGAANKVPIPTRRAPLDALEASDKTRSKLDDPANDKTLSPFFCSPVDK
jgi:hypothetical protein